MLIPLRDDDLLQASLVSVHDIPITHVSSSIYYYCISIFPAKPTNIRTLVINFGVSNALLIRDDGLGV